MVCPGVTDRLVTAEPSCWMDRVSGSSSTSTSSWEETPPERAVTVTTPPVGGAVSTLPAMAPPVASRLTEPLMGKKLVSASWALNATVWPASTAGASAVR